MSIVKVGCGEYRTVYLHDDGTVWATLWDSLKGQYKYMQYLVGGILDVAGGQYTCLGWNNNGVAYEFAQSGSGSPMAISISVPQKKIIYGQMFLQAKLLVDEAGDVYYLAESSDKDVLKMGYSNTPKLILSGYGIKKIEVAEDYLGMLMITNRGDVYKWDRGAANPLLVYHNAVDIAVVGRGVFIINSLTDLLAWGPNSQYVGIPNSGYPVSILKKWPVKLPIIKMVGNWNTLHIIDANGDMWAAGENIMGEVGNGKGNPNWKDYKNGTTPQPFAWSWASGQMIQPPIKLDGKWSDVFTSNSMAFYVYAIDQKGQLYSWGRNKKRALGNGRTLPDNDLDAKYPNWEDVWYPTWVSPDKITAWTVIDKFDPATAPNNAPFTPIPPDPPKPIIKQVGYIEIGRWGWHLYDNGNAEGIELSTGQTI